MKIGQKTLETLGELAKSALIAHMEQLNTAFKKNEETTLKIGMKGTITPGAAAGRFKLKVDIDYVIEKATDSFIDYVDEYQTSLELDEEKVAGGRI